jgi:predicted acetyltransferase
MTERYPIRPVGEEDFTAFYAVGEHAFNSSWPSEASRENERVTIEFDRTLAAFDGARPVGTACAYTFQMALPGRMAPVAGVSAVSVLPSYRRRGILSSLMRRQFADIQDGHEAVAALFASEPGIYGRFGYGMASLHAKFTILRGESQMIPPAPARLAGADRDGDVQLRQAEPEAARAELAKVYDQAVPGRPGMLARDDRWWNAALLDPEYWRQGASPLRCLIAEDAAGARGYALFSVNPTWDEHGIPNGSLNIRELVSLDPAATAALWADLLSRDLVGEVKARIRPADDPLLYLLADIRRARAQVTDGLWIRLIDVGRALAQRQYARDVDVVIEVADELLPGNAGRWRLQADPAAGGASCERTSAPADVTLPVQSLGAAYLGGTRLGALARAGLVAEARPGAVAELSAAMSWDPLPWSPMIF